MADFAQNSATFGLPALAVVRGETADAGPFWQSSSAYSANVGVAHYWSADQVQGLLYPPADLQLLPRRNAVAKIENVEAGPVGCGDGAGRRRAGWLRCSMRPPALLRPGTGGVPMPSAGGEGAAGVSGVAVV